MQEEREERSGGGFGVQEEREERAAVV